MTTAGKRSVLGGQKLLFDAVREEIAVCLGELFRLNREPWFTPTDLQHPWTDIFQQKCCKTKQKKDWNGTSFCSPLQTEIPLQFGPPELTLETKVSGSAV
mmetsp:Transcript_28315/g.64142  ORF Transcript_28315/g.64142 Transcript_28315/m.64142 type:complete len:100 (+) Transcript_28315:119-418(+)